MIIDDLTRLECASERLAETMEMTTLGIGLSSIMESGTYYIRELHTAIDGYCANDCMLETCPDDCSLAGYTSIEKGK